MKQKQSKDFEFINKSVFFPKHGILAIGDLHVGYEQSLRDSGVLMPENQIKEIINDLEKIIKEIRSKNQTLSKIIFLGDVKHYFGYEWKERFYFNKILDFLSNYFDEENIILIRGNHDTFDFTGKEMKDFFIEEGIAFLHGHKEFKEVFDKKIKTIVTGHLHSSVLLEDRQGIKREKYKCYLVGKFKNKTAIILPSFFGIIEGTPVNNTDYNDKDFSIIPTKAISKFRAYVIGEKGEIFNFGEVRKIKS